jgi:hypothetical protein
MAAPKRERHTLFGVGTSRLKLCPQEHIMTRNNLVAFAAALGMSGLFFAAVLV